MAMGDDDNDVDGDDATGNKVKNDGYGATGDDNDNNNDGNDDDNGKRRWRDGQRRNGIQRRQ